MKKYQRIFFILFLPGLAYAQVNKRIIILDRPQVTLKDLFGNEVKKDQIIGNSPSVGGQFLVSSAQMSAIATQYKSDLSSQVDLNEIAIKRAGTLVRKNFIKRILEDALKHDRRVPDSEIFLKNFTPVVVPSETIRSATINQFNYSRQDHSFSAIVQISTLEHQAYFLKASGYIKPFQYGFTTKYIVQAGQKIACTHLDKIKLPNSGEVSANISALDDICGKIAKLSIYPGHLIRNADLTSLDSVLKGRVVTMYTQLPGLFIKTEGVALSSGNVGSRIDVLNPISNDIVKAVVTSENETVVDPNSSPASRSASKNLYNNRTNYYESMHRT